MKYHTDMKIPFEQISIGNRCNNEKRLTCIFPNIYIIHEIHCHKKTITGKF